MCRAGQSRCWTRPRIAPAPLVVRPGLRTTRSTPGVQRAGPRHGVGLGPLCGGDGWVSPNRSREQSNEAPPACQWPPNAAAAPFPRARTTHRHGAASGERKGARDRCAQVVSRDDRRTAAPSRSPSANRPILPRPPRRATRVKARRIPIVGIGIGIGGWLRPGRCEMQSPAGGRHADAQPADELALRLETRKWAGDCRTAATLAAPAMPKHWAWGRGPGACLLAVVVLGQVTRRPLAHAAHPPPPGFIGATWAEQLLRFWPFEGQAFRSAPSADQARRRALSRHPPLFFKASSTPDPNALLGRVGARWSVDICRATDNVSDCRITAAWKPC